MIFGTFDIVHQGHLNLFLNAKKWGDFLIAVVARDARAEEIKKKKLIHTEKERKKFLEAIRYIDQVILGNKTDVYKIINQIKPDVIVLGYDQKHFTESLTQKIQEFQLKTKVVRLKAHKPNNFKTQKLREILEKQL